MLVNIMNNKIALLKEFILKFTDLEVIDFDSVININDSFFIKNDDFENSTKILSDSLYNGILVGRIDKGNFVPSFFLLEMLVEVTDKKVILNDKAEWLFLCGRDAFSKSYLTKAPDYEGEVLVLNGRGELLGYGHLSGSGVKNLLDRGDFLRREMNKTSRKN